MKNENKKIIISIIKGLLFLLALFLILKVYNNALANNSIDLVGKYFKNNPDLSNKTTESVVVNIVYRSVNIVKFIMGVIAFLMGSLYVILLVFSRGDTEVLEKTKTGFLWMFVGFLVIMGAQTIADIFNPIQSTKENLINYETGKDLIKNIADWLKWLLGSTAVIIMSISGLKMITARGDEETIKEEKTNLIYGSIGLLVVLLASGIINAIYVVNNGEVKLAESSNGILQIAGVIRLILLFLAPLTIVFTIYAGFIYLKALSNEDETKNAKKIITYGIIGMIFIYSSYTIVNTFISANIT